MSRILDAEPYIEELPTTSPPPLPPPPVQLSVEEAMQRVEEVARAARGDGFASSLNTSDPNVIRVEPSLGEISVLDIMQRARPYMVAVFALAAACIVARLLVVWRRRYRDENVADTRARPMDRRSVVREQRRRKSD